VLFSEDRATECEVNEWPCLVSFELWVEGKKVGLFEVT